MPGAGGHRNSPSWLDSVSVAGTGCHRAPVSSWRRKNRPSRGTTSVIQRRGRRAVGTMRQYQGQERKAREARRQASRESRGDSTHCLACTPISSPVSIRSLFVVGGMGGSVATARNPVQIKRNSVGREIHCFHSLHVGRASTGRSTTRQGPRGGAGIYCTAEWSALRNLPETESLCLPSPSESPKRSRDQEEPFLPLSLPSHSPRSMTTTMPHPPSTDRHRTVSSVKAPRSSA